MPDKCGGRRVTGVATRYRRAPGVLLHSALSALHKTGRLAAYASAWTQAAASLPQPTCQRSLGLYLVETPPFILVRIMYVFQFA